MQFGFFLISWLILINRISFSLKSMIDSIEKALSEIDVLITTGSVSMGDKDMLKPILKEIFKATIHFGKTAQKKR